MAETVTLVFDPWSLPTAQHRAGLAGLLVQIESLRRRDVGPLPDVDCDAEGRWRVTLDEERLTLLFDDLYDAKLEEVSTTKKRSKAEPRRVEEGIDPKTGKPMVVYVYEKLTPIVGFLEALGMPELWLRLWRDCVLGVVRPYTIPATQAPYKERLAGKHVGIASKVWTDLRILSRERANGGRGQRLDTVASTLMLGAQEHNPDLVPSRGLVEENLLLHYWPIVSAIYQPEAMDRNGKVELQKGFVIAVPDVEDIEGFVEDFPSVVGALDPAPDRYRPRGSVISVPQEGALEYCRSLARVAKASASRGKWDFTVGGIEVFTVEPQAKGVRLIGTHRVDMSERTLERYEEVRRGYRNPVFRRQLITNILRDEPWYKGFDRALSTVPYGLAVGSAASFAVDARAHFRVVLGNRKE